MLLKIQAYKFMLVTLQVLLQTSVTLNDFTLKIKHGNYCEITVNVTSYNFNYASRTTLYNQLTGPYRHCHNGSRNFFKLMPRNENEWEGFSGFDVSDFMARINIYVYPL